MHFDIIDLKQIRALKLRSENVKKGFLTQSNLGTPRSFRPKIRLIAEISHTNHILQRRFYGAFWYHIMNR